MGEEERKEKEEERKEEEENDSLLFDYYTGWILEFLEDSSIFPHCLSVELPEWEAGKESPSSSPYYPVKLPQTTPSSEAVLKTHFPLFQAWFGKQENIKQGRPFKRHNQDRLGLNYKFS